MLYSQKMSVKVQQIMQQIFIEGLEVPTLIGVYDWERTQNTVLIVDLLIDADLSAAMQSDDVEHTIDYAAVAETVKQVGIDSSFELLEAFANAIINAVCHTLCARSPHAAETRPFGVWISTKIADGHANFVVIDRVSYSISIWHNRPKSRTQHTRGRNCRTRNFATVKL